MPHKYTTEEVITRLRDEIQTCDASIRRVQQISRGDRDGFEALKAQVKDFLETAKEKKDNALDLMETDDRGNIYPVDMQQKIAHLCRGQEKAFGIILDMMENANSSVSYYESQKSRAQEELEKMKQYEVRK